jgi:hypothetical protein
LSVPRYPELSLRPRLRLATMARLLHPYEQYFCLWTEYLVGSKSLPQLMHCRNLTGGAVLSSIVTFSFPPCERPPTVFVVSCLRFFSFHKDCRNLPMNWRNPECGPAFVPARLIMRREFCLLDLSTSSLERPLRVESPVLVPETQYDVAGNCNEWLHRLGERDLPRSRTRERNKVTPSASCEPLLTLY